MFCSFDVAFALAAAAGAAAVAAATANAAFVVFPRRASPQEFRNRNGHCSFFHAQGRLLCIL